MGSSNKISLLRQELKTLENSFTDEAIVKRIRSMAHLSWLLFDEGNHGESRRLLDDANNIITYIRDRKTELTMKEFVADRYSSWAINAQIFKLWLEKVNEQVHFLEKLIPYETNEVKKSDLQYKLDSLQSTIKNSIETAKRRGDL